MLKTQFISQPWQHVITDDFIPDSLVEAVAEKLKGYIDYEPYFLNPNSLEFQLESHIPVYSSDYFFFEEIFDSLFEPVFSHLPGLKKWEDLKKETLWDFAPSLQPLNFDYEIHTDAPWKLVSNILYVKPQTGSVGTHLHESMDGAPNTVEWKGNRLLSFYPEPNLTYHSYTNKTQLPRLTLNAFLVLKRDYPAPCHIRYFKK